MAKYLVSFIDKGNCEIAEVVVECHWPWNAAKMAVGELSAEKRKAVTLEAVKVTVEKE